MLAILFVIITRRSSVNEIICHGIPDLYKLQNGDIVNVDVTVFHRGYHSDLNETFYVGEVDAASKHLVRTAAECLQKAIAEVRPGTRYRDIGDIISKHAQGNDLSVVRTYCGHGINNLFHCAPSIPHYSSSCLVIYGCPFVDRAVKQKIRLWAR